MQVLFQTAEISLNLTKSVLSSLDLTKKIGECGAKKKAPNNLETYLRALDGSIPTLVV